MRLAAWPKRRCRSCKNICRPHSHWRSRLRLRVEEGRRISFSRSGWRPLPVPTAGRHFFSDRLLELGGVGPACLEFLHCLLAAHGVAPILRALGPHRDFPEPWHALRSLGREKDTTNKMISFEHVVVIGRPLAIAAFSGAR